MALKRIGKDIDADTYWREQSDSYAEAIEDGRYHESRLRVVRALVAGLEPSSVVDFGCGEGVLADDYPELVGIDPSEELLEIGRERHPGCDFRLGGVEQLAGIDDGSVDLLLSINVLAYLDDDEERSFYEHAERLVRPGGHLAVTHSNELFDLYTLNAYTVDFHARHGLSDTSVAPLLTRAEEPAGATTYNVRENPLAYRHKLARHGFDEVRQEFFRGHSRPPLLGQEDQFEDTLEVSEDERWKLLLTCSTYASLSRRR